MDFGEEIGKVFVASLIIISLIKITNYFSMHFTFCQEILPYHSKDAIRQRAMTKGYRYFETCQAHLTVISVPNHDFPFFRLSCVMTFQGEKMIEKKVIADD